MDTSPLPERVIVSLGEIAEGMNEGSWPSRSALASGHERDGGRRGRAGWAEGQARRDRTGVRHGGEHGSVTLGGRRMPVTGPGCAPPTARLSWRSPRMSCSAGRRSSAGWRWSGCWRACRAAVTRTGLSRSVSGSMRQPGDKPVCGLAEVRCRDRARPGRADAAHLSTVDLVAFMVDGVHFAEACCVVALGIGIEGHKHPLALVEGSTENATLVGGLLVGLRERGLDVTRPMLVGMDGSKALRRAVVEVFDRPVIQRCQLHYADVRIMPIWVVDPLRGNGFVAGEVGIIRALRARRAGCRVGGSGRRGCWAVGFGRVLSPSGAGRRAGRSGWCRRFRGRARAR